MKPACAYQGGKVRLAPQIVSILLETGAKRFADVGCGSGAVSLELVNRGVVTSNLLMADSGPWGLVWEKIGAGRFSLAVWNSLLDDAPRDPRDLYSWVYELSSGDARELTAYVFLVLQAAAFGSKAIWVSGDGKKWCNTTFRRYWEPTATSNRRSPVNPMMPMPETLRERVVTLVNGMRGVQGKCSQAEVLDFKGIDVVYIDPPYAGTTAYGHSMNVSLVISKALESGVSRVFVSEGRPLAGASSSVCLSTGRSKGGISGERAKAHAEFLSEFRA